MRVCRYFCRTSTLPNLENKFFRATRFVDSAKPVTSIDLRRSARTAALAAKGLQPRPLTSKNHHVDDFFTGRFTEVSNNTNKQSDVVSEMFTMGHEKVLICQDPKSGLKAIIAVHSTVCGPSLGGTRMWQYKNEAEALRDVLRLSRGMTYKNAISNLNLGGGKAVIIGDSRKDKSEKLFRSFGRYVESLAGDYITAEDVGISPEDMIHISKETKHVSGMPGKSGDPSPVTAFGVYMGMKAAAKVQFGSDSLNGKKVAVQGVGHVGEYLVGYLAKEGADIVRVSCPVNLQILLNLGVVHIYHVSLIEVPLPSS